MSFYLTTFFFVLSMAYRQKITHDPKYAWFQFSKGMMYMEYVHVVPVIYVRF